MGLTLAAAARYVVDPVLALVFPTSCAACRAPMDHPRSGPLCDGCWGTLPRHASGMCVCGVPLVSAHAGACGRCRRGLSPFERGASLGPYDGALRVVIHELKYRGRRRAAAQLAHRLDGEAGVREVLGGADVLVPVPLHPRRRRERGFNQAELLAAELGRRAAVPVAAEVLVRRADTASQAGLTAARRRANVAGAFAVRHRSRVAGRIVVLVDDVYTTGATARACARALRDAGAAEVRLLTVARVD
jgi:ComF family protein